MLPYNERHALSKALAFACCGLLVVAAVPAVSVFAQESTDDDEPNDSMANATPIEYGEEIDANLSSPSDVDYYAVDATAGNAILPRLYLKNRFEGSAIAVDVVTPSGEVSTELTNDLIDGPQNVAGENIFDPTDTAYTGDVMESDGTYYVRVREPETTAIEGPETNESDTYRYSLTVNTTDVDQHEPNENGTTATSIEVGETTEASFAGYDSDVYAVNLTAGENYTVTLDHPDQEEFPATNKVIWVYGNESQPVDDPFWKYAEDNKSPYHYDPNGTTVASSGDIYDRTGSVSFTPEENKTYYVQIMQSEMNGNLLEQDQYELTVNRTAGTPPGDGAGESELPDGEDADSDGLTNAEEEDFGTDPRDADTDGDGVADGTEATEC